MVEVTDGRRGVICAEHETAMVELEKRQLLEKQQLEEMQLKDKFIQQRHLLMTRQAKVSCVTVNVQGGPKNFALF